MCLGVGLKIPSLELFSWSPIDAPQTILPESKHLSKWIQPFEIPPPIFHFFLEPKVPITIAAVYLVTVMYLNRLNQDRQHKPWGFANTATFRGFVVFHNVLLAIFSAFIFHGLCCALWNCLPLRTDPNFLANVADSLCRVVDTTWSTPTREFQVDSKISAQLQTDRLWDSGYAFLGWVFYVSKLYEVVDTCIILAKGKKCSILQMYHHAGVIICAWSAVRYMSPPSVVAVLLNSAIHTLMYSYYALSALAFRIPKSSKRTLTSLQIAQFIGGCTIACSYSIVEYDTPVHQSANYGIVAHSTLDVIEKPSCLPGFPTVSESSGNISSLWDEFEIRRVPCIQDRGQAFALWLTTLYCLPLIYLFVRFFIRSYIRPITGASR